jgi:hypothetical protein
MAAATGGGGGVTCHARAGGHPVNAGDKVTALPRQIATAAITGSSVFADDDKKGDDDKKAMTTKRGWRP